MASTRLASPAHGCERPPSGAPVPSSRKHRKTCSGSSDGGRDDGSVTKTSLDVIVENWASMHEFLELSDMVLCSRTCSRLHELCVDEEGKVRHVNEICWDVDEDNFDHIYRILHSVRFDGIKGFYLSFDFDSESPAALSVLRKTMIFTILSSPRANFPILETLELLGGSCPDGLEMLFADLGSKLANHSPALRASEIRNKAFSRTAFELMKPLLEKNLLTKLALCDDIGDCQEENLIGNDQAKELAELVVSSTNLEHLEIDLFSLKEDEINERVSLWFKTKLVPAIRAGLNNGRLSANQSRLQHLCFALSPIVDVSCYLNPDELELLLNHFSGPQLSDFELHGNWASTGNISRNTERASADTIGRVLSCIPSLTDIDFTNFYDDEGCLWSALARFIFEKDSPCRVRYLPCVGSRSTATFMKGLRNGVESMIPCIKGRGGGSNLDATITDHCLGWTIRVHQTVK